MDARLWIEGGIVAGLLCLALLPLAWRLGWTSRSSIAWLGVAIAAFVVAAIGVRRSPLAEADVSNRPIEVATDGYVSSDACRSCHPAEYASWHASYHRTMTQRATPDAVIPSFDGVAVHARGRDYHLQRRGDSFWVDMVDPEWRGSEDVAPRLQRQIVMTTGSHHEQDFWYETDQGRAIAHLPIVYRIPEQRWLPNGSTFLQPPLPPGPPGPSEVGGWNRNCLQCHATHGQPRFDAGNADTHVAEFGIACEACHGPAAEHIAIHQDPRHRYGARGRDDADPTIVHPARLSPQRSSEVCGQCHMVSTVFSAVTHPEWNEAGHRYRPSDVLADSRDIVRVADADRPPFASIVETHPGFLADRFWSDGMIRVSGREYNGLVETPCFQRGPMSCLSCHTMHQRADDPRSAREWADDQLGADKVGDAACTQCHAEIGAAVETHTYHPESSSGSRCYNCHMPHTTWGLLKAIRSHQVDSPAVQASLETGRPNACNLCHLDETLAWSAKHLERWYGIDSPQLTADESEIAASVLWLLRGDAGQRALVAWSFAWDPARAVARRQAGGRWVVPFLAHLLDDPYDAVRFVAAEALVAHSVLDSGSFDYVAPREERVAIQQRVLARTHDSEHDDADSKLTRLLLQADGSLDVVAFDRIAAERDDRRVELRE